LRIQKELETLDSADKALNEDKMSDLNEEDALVAKASKIVGDPIESIDLLGLAIDELPNISKFGKNKLKEIQDRLCDLHKDQLQNDLSRKEIQMEDLSKARSILNEPELTLEDLLDLDIPKIKNLLPSEKKDLTRIQNDLKLAHESDLKDALKNANSRKN